MLRTRNIVLLILVLIAVNVGLRIYNQTGSLVPALDAKTSTQALFAASFHDSAGDLQSLAQYRGKLLVVNFWASWCPPCLEEMPELSSLQTQYLDRNLVVLGISTDDVDKMRNFAAHNQVSYPLLAGDFGAMQLAESLGNSKGALPYTVIIKPDGSIHGHYFGRVSQALLEQALLPLM